MNFKKNILVAVASAGILLQSVLTVAGVVEEINSAQEVMARIEQFTSGVADKSSVLIAWDIDNTLLKLNQDLGSEPWFVWQDGMIRSFVEAKKTNPDATCVHCAASDFDGLLAINSLLLLSSASSPVEPRLPTAVSELQKAGYVSIVLTSRGPELVEGTTRELKRAGFDFSQAEKQLKTSGELSPYLSTDFDPAEVTQMEAAKCKIANPKNILVRQGIYLTSGQCKGAVLRGIVERHRKYEEFSAGQRKLNAVILVDNDKKHLDRFNAAFDPSFEVSKSVKTLAIRYNHEDADIAAFSKAGADGSPNSRQIQTVWALGSLRKTIGEVFPGSSLGHR